MTGDRFEAVELPVHTLPDGRQFVTDHDVVRLGAQDFIGRFSNYWSREGLRDGWVSPTPEATDCA